MRPCSGFPGSCTKSGARSRIIPSQRNWTSRRSVFRLSLTLNIVVRAPVEKAAGELALRQHGVGGEDAPGDVGQRVDQRDDDADLVRPLPLAAVTRVQNGFF